MISRTIGNWSRRSSGISRPRRLVLGVLLVPEGRAREVERDRDVVGLDVLEAAQDDAPEAEHRVDELALARGQRRDQREIAAVDEPVGVEQHQAVHRVECTGGGSGHRAGAASLQAWRRPARRAIGMTAVSPEYPPPRRYAPVVSVLPVRAVRRAEHGRIGVFGVLDLRVPPPQPVFRTYRIRAKDAAGRCYCASLRAIGRMKTRTRPATRSTSQLALVAGSAGAAVVASGAGPGAVAS